MQRTLDPSLHPCHCVRDHNPEPRVIHSHHIVPLGMDGPDTQANQVPLCPTAHDNVHWMIRAFLAKRPVGRQNPYLVDLALDALAGG